MINRRDVLSLGALASVGLAMASRAETIPTTATTADKSPINKGKSVRGTQTEKCLLKAFAGESQARLDALYTDDARGTLRFSHENPEIQALYRDFYGKPLSAKAEKMLHTQYASRAKDLG